MAANEFQELMTDRIGMSEETYEELVNQGIDGLRDLAILSKKDISNMALTINKLRDNNNPNIWLNIVAIRRLKAARMWIKLRIQMDLW